MRNLKRALSLALASVMLLGMMVVGTGASYADVTSKHNEEAISVMQAVGVMVGDTNGNFNPDQKVTRGEMAVVMANLLNLKVEDFVGAKIPFTDVPEWAVPYVAACYADGITAGISATQYGFNYEVTTAQAALMMMKALGYFQYASDFGQDWQVATIKQGSKIDLFDKISTASTAALTRNDVAQLALNTLKATTVEVVKSGSTIITGDVTIIGDVKYEDVVSTADYAKAIGSTPVETGSSKYSVELGEKLYDGDLKLSGTSADDFKRPGKTWSYKGEDVAASSEDAVIVYTADTKESVVDKDLKNYKYKDSKDADSVKFWYNGYGTDAAESCTDKTIADLTGNGVVVEVYANSDNVVTDVVVIKSYLAKVSAVSDKNETITLDIVKDGIANITTELGYGTYKKDAYVMVSPKFTSQSAVGNEAYAITAATKVTGTISAVETDKSATIDGTTYKKAEIYSQSTFNPTVSNVAIVDAYVDAYGYLVDCNASTAAGNYMYVAKFWDSSYDDYGNQVNKVQGVLTDGTVGTYTVTNGSAAAGLYSYTVSDGKYTLTAAKATDSSANYGHEEGSVTISSSTVKLNSHYFDNDTNFVVVSGTAGSDLKTHVYTGKQSMAGTVTVYYLTSKSVEDDQSGTITTAFVVGSDVVTTENDLIYSTTSTKNGQVYIDGSNYDTYSLYINGEKKTVPVKGSTTPAANKFYTYGVDANGVYSLTEKNSGVVTNGVLTTVYGNYITLESVLTDGNYTAADAVVVDTRSGDPDPELNSLSALQDAVNGGKTVVVSVAYNSEKKEVSAIYVLSGALSSDTTVSKKDGGSGSVTDVVGKTIKVDYNSGTAYKMDVVLGDLNFAADSTYVVKESSSGAVIEKDNYSTKDVVDNQVIVVTAANGVTSATYTIEVADA